MTIERRPGQPLGDLDVLAPDTATRTLDLLGCKDLEVTRTPAEMSDEIAKTFGIGARKPSAAEKHAERIASVRQHLEQTLRWLGIEDDLADWTTSGRIVVDQPVMSPYVIACLLPVIMGAELPPVRTGDGAAAPAGGPESPPGRARRAPHARELRPRGVVSRRASASHIS
jgi:hypothetical protein